MSKIKIMDEVLANKIAAGEVVEKTMNVVKELVENSIDAKATEIKIELIDSGVKMIKVTDNGIGMDREDAHLAFSRHATSKLLEIEDLFNIESLGFRGEALPSIASVSKVDLKTCNGEVGTHLVLEGGKNEVIENYAYDKGTSITVENLFYNTPVRLKYLRNLYTELANISEYVNKMALSYPEIKFSLINNEKVLLDTTGNGDLLKVIYDIYGIEVAKKMVEVNKENDDYNIWGYISYPEIARSNRNSITTLVNGRVIRNNELNKTILEAYHTYIPKDKFPIIVLHIDVDPILIDINIHPTKMDIKFSKMDVLKELLDKAIKEKLEELLLIPNAATRDFLSVIDAKKSMPIANIEIEKQKKQDVKYEEVSFNFEVKDSSIDDRELSQTEETEEDVRIKRMYPKGIVYLTYIIAENEDGMYIIDQHAAAERINYEKYLNEMSKKTVEKTDLLVPMKIELPTNEYIIVKEHLSLLEEIGFDVEEFGSNTFIIRTHPLWLPKNYEEEATKKIVDLIISKEEFSKEKFIEKSAITLACRMSIKANDYINEEEMQYLLDKLRECRNPFTCPHGRPTIITYTKYDLEKLFKRAMD